MIPVSSFTGEGRRRAHPEKNARRADAAAESIFYSARA